MKTEPTYYTKGFRQLPGLIPKEICTGFLARLKDDYARQGLTFQNLLETSSVLKGPATGVYSHDYLPLTSFHWGLTPSIAGAVGEELLPTYAYFRLYRKGDVCLVHCDRYACEHSVSLTIGSSDNLPWALEVATVRDEHPRLRADESFAAGENPAAVAMMPGDAVVYQGVHHHHGRTTPNPNRWSAHLFFHWVSRNGPYAAEAFDRKKPPEKVEVD